DPHGGGPRVRRARGPRGSNGPRQDCASHAARGRGCWPFRLRYELRLARRDLQNFPLVLSSDAGTSPARRALPERPPLTGEGGSTTLTTRCLFPWRFSRSGFVPRQFGEAHESPRALSTHRLPTS